MATQKWCSVVGCKNFIFVAIDDLHEHNWTAFQTPEGKGKLRCYCPDHLKECEEDMRKSLIVVSNPNRTLTIATLEGNHTANKGEV